jgi:hypothetical protein
VQTRSIRFAISVLSACVAFGQNQGSTSQTVSAVFKFTYAQTAVDMQQITNAIRTVGEITQATLDMRAKTLIVAGTPAQTAMAQWILNTLDQPAPANQATQQYLPAGTVEDVVRILYLSHPPTSPSFQDIVNSVRTIPQMTKVFPYSSQSAIVMRGTNSEVAMAEWLFHQLDVPAGVQPAQNPAAHQYASPAIANDQVQVLFLAHPWTPQSMQQITNTLHVIPQLTKVFQCPTSGVISLRGPTATVALATWLFSQLDQTPPSSAPGPREFQMPGGADDVTQMFYLTPAPTAQAFTNIVTALRATPSLIVFPDDIWNAVALRGTATQIAAADSLIKQMNQP